MKKSQKKPVKRKAAKKHTGAKVTAPSLTICQKRCCDAYHAMTKPNKRTAYESVYEARGKTAKVEAHRMMKLPHVKAYLDSLKEVATENAQRTADEIIAELEKIAFSNIGDFLKFDVKKGIELFSSSKLTKAQLAVINEMNDYFTKQGTRRLRLKLHNKLHALELLGKKHGLFPNRQELTGKGGGPVEVTVVHFSKKKR